jgi:lysyl-tRNA synthetase class 2
MPSRHELITQQRREKLDRIRSLGIDPYPARYHRRHTTEQAVKQLEELERQPDKEKVLDRMSDRRPDEVSIAGRIVAMRRMGKSAFADIRDGSGQIQVLFQDINKYEPDQIQLFRTLDIGDLIGIKGNLLRTKSGEPTVWVAEFILLAKSLQTLPEKWHGLTDIETRYRQRYLDLISNEKVRTTFRIRTQVISAIRSFLDAHGFIEAETPILLPSAGGALAQPFVTHHNTLDQDFYLRIATELHLKRLIIGGFEKVYEIGRTFRNEGISTEHNPEFTMLESYEAYADYNDVMKMVEEMIAAVCHEVIGTCLVPFGEDTLNFEPPWQSLTLRDAIRQYSGIDFVQYPDVIRLAGKMKEMGMDVDTKKNWAKLVDELLKTFVRPRLIQPTIIYDYPLSMSPLAKNKAGQERVVERFQAYAGGLEIGNAYSELNDPVEQRERFEAQLLERQGDDEERWTIDEDFLQALEYGMPPTGGLGVGIDRLVMLLTNQQSIREVILFPQLKDKP